MDTRILLALCLLLACQDVESKRIQNYSDNDINENTISDDRIVVNEPIKSMLQTGARFMLAQTSISNHVNLDTAMDFINNIGYMIGKTSTLIKLVEVVAVSIVGLLGASLFFPGFFLFMASVWRDPVNTLNLDKYLSNGLSERSVLGVIGSTTDEALSRVGLQEGSCRERSICHLGEMLKCTFPDTSETVAKWASNNFSSSSFNENKYFRAFTYGFVDRNCTKVAWSSDNNDGRNCLGSFVGSILKSRPFSDINSVDSGKGSKKYQSMQPVSRA